MEKAWKKIPRRGGKSYHGAMRAIHRIISVSRRTDIPAFYSEWFINRLREGYALVPNPFNPSQVSTVLLDRAHVACFVFVTKDPRPMLPRLEELDRRGYNYLFQVTVTGLPRVFEPHVPETAEILAAMRELGERIGPERVIWRFDPLVISDASPVPERLARFRQMAGELRGSVRQVLFSFVRDYRQVRLRLARRTGLPQVSFVSAREAAGSAPELFAALAETAAQNGMELISCADSTDLSGFGIGKGRCIDAGLINRLFNLSLPLGKGIGQRTDCSCHASADLGMYGTCPHRCIYCYACTDANLDRLRHDPRSPLLAGEAPPPAVKEQPALF